MGSQGTPLRPGRRIGQVGEFVLQWGTEIGGRAGKIKAGRENGVGGGETPGILF